MYSIPVIIKLALLTLVALGCLWIFTHLGGLWFAAESRGYLVIYNQPHLKPAMVVFSGEDGDDGLKPYQAYMDKYVRTVLEVRAANSFRDVAVVHWASLAVAVLCIISFFRTMNAGHKKHKRYFKSRRLYEDKLKF